MLKEDMTARSKMEVVFDILEIADIEGSFEGHYDDNNEHHTGGGGVIQSEIMNKALLGNNQLKEYLNVLTENDLLSFDSATRKFKITQKGHRFVQLYNKLSDLVKEGQEQQI
jgi:predicted transcriptional regulator